MREGVYASVEGLKYATNIHNIKPSAKLLKP
jgi:hypothetical protein